MIQPNIEIPLIRNDEKLVITRIKVEKRLFIVFNDIFFTYFVKLHVKRNISKNGGCASFLNQIVPPLLTILWIYLQYFF